MVQDMQTPTGTENPSIAATTAVFGQSASDASAENCFVDIKSALACNRKFDRILSNHVLHEWKITGVLHTARALLTETGRLTVVDDFCIIRREEKEDTRTYIPYFNAQAERLGLDIVEAQKEGDRYVSITLKLGKAPRWINKLFQEEDLEAFQKLFHTCFNSSISRQLWFWKYGENRGQQVGIWSGDEMVGHYGGSTRRVLREGKPFLATQISDVMVKPSERGVLSRRGPLAQSATTYIENWCGWGSKHPFGFGFPNSRHMGVAERLGLYADVGQVSQVDWDATPNRFDWKLRAIRQRPEPATVEKFWAAMAADFTHAIIGIRDYPHFKHRYLDHPHHDYQIWLVKRRFAKQELGLMVLRAHPDSMELIDLIAPRKSFPELIEKARRITASQNLPRLFCWISEPYADDFVAMGGMKSDPDVRIPTNILSDGPAPETLRDRWWLMGGDTDFR